MALFRRIIKHLLPRAKAWSITIDKALTRLLNGIADSVPPAVREFIDKVYLDLWPGSTREVDAWEEQFDIPRSTVTTQQRRERISAAWKAVGGQSPRYIQDTLRNAGFDVYLHEWWQLPIGTEVDVFFGEAGQTGAEAGETEMLAGNIIGTISVGEREPRNPFNVVSDANSNLRYFLSSGAATAVCGGQQAICGATNKPTGYLLVNKPQGGPYTIPNDVEQWRYILYVGGPEFGDVATVSPARRNEFETLLLKICPAQQWIGVLVEYS